MSKRIGLSGAVLKFIACVAMVIDHVGYIFFPDAEWMRIIGRLAFPIFAFFIAEGCRYTKHRARYLLQIAGLGIVCEAVYLLAGYPYYGNILLTFSLSIALIYLWQLCQRCLMARKRVGFVWLLLFWAATATVWHLVDMFGVDYGFAGVMVAVLLSFTNPPDGKTKPKHSWWFSVPTRTAVFTVALLWAAYTNLFPDRQYWSLMAVPLMLLYNGKPGKHRFKYGFYVFYPLHLAVLQGIAMLIAT